MSKFSDYYQKHCVWLELIVILLIYLTFLGMLGCSGLNTSLQPQGDAREDGAPCFTSDTSVEPEGRGECLNGTNLIDFLTDDPEVRDFLCGNLDVGAE